MHGEGERNIVEPLLGGFGEFVSNDISSQGIG